MTRVLTLPVVIFVLSVALLVASGFLFFVAGKSFGVESSSELIAPVEIEPSAEKLFTTSVFDKVRMEKTTDNYPPSNYFPVNVKALTEVDLELTAATYAVMDRDTRELLIARNHTSERQIASLTKVMTALVAMDKEKMDKMLVVPQVAAEVGEAEMGLSAGEQVQLEDLLYGLLMVSGNDAAETIARGTGRGRYWFIEEMNKKAYSIGLKDTYFVNPTGLDEETQEKSSFSTALDLLALVNYALTKPEFAEIVGTKYHEIYYKENYHKAFFLDNILSFDLTYPGIKGVKTGNTDFAGQTLISYVEHKGRRILVVLLGSSASRDDVVKIYKWVFGEEL